MFKEYDCDFVYVVSKLLYKVETTGHFCMIMILFPTFCTVLTLRGKNYCILN